jgi:hypothetical protein
VFVSLLAALFAFPMRATAQIIDGANAVDMLGQYD